MTWSISPDTYDVIVVGSGLPECLVAASLVKAGKSVLIIDAVDTYGTDFASFTPAALHDVFCQQQQKPPQINTPHQHHQASGASISPSGTLEGPTQAGPTPVSSHDHEHEHSVPASLPMSTPMPPGARLLRLAQRSLPLTGIRAFAAAPHEAGRGDAGAGLLKDRRSYIFDLVPKLVYQAEGLVDLLVRCRCHHYLEFKAVEGSYILQDGALQPVPAGRADIFRDRRLGLADKRLLMRFIQGCMEARSGQGHLKEALSSSQPLAQILQAEGLSPRLREVILYGIAMCDADQEPPAAAAAAAAAAATQAPAEPAAAAAAAGGNDCGGHGGAARLMSGSEGGSALELFTSSQGRFGQECAFMVPCYGSGSVAEAFVRLCAVHGAVTVLRQPVQALVVGPPEAAGTAGTAPETAAEADASEVAAETAAAGVAVAAGPECGGGEVAVSTGPPSEGQGLSAPMASAAAAGVAAADVAGGGGTGGGDGISGGGGGTGSGGGGGGGGGRGDGGSGDTVPDGVEACLGVVTAAGQLVRCGAVVAGVSTLSCLEGGSAAGTPEASTSTSTSDFVSRAVVVLDGPLQPASAATTAGSTAASATTSQTKPTAGGTPAAATATPAAASPAPPSLVTAVVPPRAVGRGGGAASNPHPVRVLQQGASTCVCPSGRYLLYLSTPATSASSHDDLWPALDLLADPSALREVSALPPPPPAGPDSSPGAGAGAGPSPAASGCSGNGAETGAPATAAAAGAEGSGAPDRPRALYAWFYRQPVLHRCRAALEPAAAPEEVPSVAAARRLPATVVALPGADGSLAGYEEVLRATEAVFRSAFPGVTWLAEADFTPPAAADGAAEDGVAGGSAGIADEDDDAIDELTAAVARLQDS